MKSHIPLIALTAAAAFLIGRFAGVPVAQAATPSADDLYAQVQALQTKVAAIERSVPTALPAGAPDPVAVLQSQVAAINQVLSIAPSGITLKTKGSIWIEAGAALDLRGSGTTTVAGSFLKLNGGNKAVSHANGTSPTVLVP